MTLRLDLFLKKTHLLKRRELARELCEEGMVRVNGTPRKASFEVKPDDELAFPIYNRALKVRILGIPEGNIAKSDQWSFVEILEDRRLPVDEGAFDDPTLPRPKPPREH
ncbi:S4 domain-containing protein [Holophaga foetida]|uniref:S4 domain-containing protein n=1 Tax=Holophaga foetida TaxID=35839 RepID=UPI0002472F31|nr:S4 domain-containing protein [Holophaga foetida]